MEAGADQEMWQLGLSFNCNDDDFENPSIDLEMNASDGIVIDDYSVNTEGTFQDAPAQEDVPGSMEASWGDQSRR